MSKKIPGKGSVRNGLSKHKLYPTWSNMIYRCYDQNNIAYKRYGAMGVTVCSSWLESFENFLADMGEQPTPQHSIDRINNKGNYEPSNCRWATSKQQTRNSTLTRLTEKDVKNIRKLLQAGMMQKDVATLYCVSSPTVWAICHNKSWT